MIDALLVASLGAFGVLTRYFIDGLFNIQKDAFPLSTFSINMIGCTLLGFLSVFFIGKSSSLNLALTVGFCGGFTTFSTFTFQILQLFNSDQALKAISYLLLSLVLGLLCCFLGIKLAKLLS